ncbi:MAG: hemerythrin domain-containing protein [Pseudomonadota bacterium]
MRQLQQFCEEHRNIEREAASLADAVSTAVPDAASVAVARWRLARLLFDHCTREDQLVYGRLAVSGDQEATRIAWRYRQTYGTMMERFGVYIREWPVGRILAEWVLFQRATHEILALIEGRVAEEERELFPLARRIFLRDAA